MQLKLNREQAAEYLGVTAGTLSVWACIGRYSLPYIKIGSKVFYLQSDLDDFIKKRRRFSSTDVALIGGRSNEN